MRNSKDFFPCWVCNEPQDTAPNRLCINCQCCVAKIDSITGLQTFKEAILEMRNNNNNNNNNEC